VLSKQSGFRKTWTKGARKELGDIVQSEQHF
jgi:hypothetical protein